MWTIQFWKDLLERALKSAAQALILVAGGTAFNVWHADWKMISGVVLSGFLLSALTSITSGALPFGNPGTASLTKAVEPAAPTEHTDTDGAELT